MAEASGFTLTQIAVVARKAIYGVAIGFAALAIMTYIVRQINEYNRLHPPKVVEKPDYALGSLPKFVVPKSEKVPAKMTLEIGSGYYPETPAVFKVFGFQAKKSVGFDPVKTARDFAAKAGFAANEKKIAEGEYVFSDKLNPLRTMQINAIDQAFQIKSDLRSDYKLIVESGLPSPEEAIAFSKTFLQSNDLEDPSKAIEGVPTLAEDAGRQMQNIFYYRLTPLGTLETTNLPFEANLIQVVFQENLVDGKIIYFAKETEGPAVFMLAGGNQETDKRVVEAKYAYFPVDTNNFGTYPSKSADAAWSQLQSGKGYIVSLGTAVDVVVRTMSIGYYDDLTGKNLLQPIWVFEGDSGFKAYVPAIKDVALDFSK